MKDAHVNGVSCSLFRKLVMDFVDDELSEQIRCDFISHADTCRDCRRELNEVQLVRKLLAGLPAATVSPEFDFRLKASLRLEDAHLRKPVYRLKLYIRDNFVPVIGVPVAAVFLLVGVLFYQESFRSTPPGVQVAEQKHTPESGVPFKSPADIQTEDVNYVLESLNLGEIGIEVSPQSKAGAQQPNLNTVSLINF